MRARRSVSHLEPLEQGVGLVGARAQRAEWSPGGAVERGALDPESSPSTQNASPASSRPNAPSGERCRGRSSRSLRELGRCVAARSTSHRAPCAALELCDVARREQRPDHRRLRRALHRSPPPATRRARRSRPSRGRAARRAFAVEGDALGRRLHLERGGRRRHDDVESTSQSSPRRSRGRARDVPSTTPTETAATEGRSKKRPSRGRSDRVARLARRRRRRSRRSVCRRRPGGRRSRGDRALAERLEVADDAYGAPDQALDLDRASALLAARASRSCAPRSRRQQRVLGRHPAARCGTASAATPS